ncbi:MAG: hypothetical protein OQK46_08750 [Gammaproteobacteria bacterium]|nr:hypothetical protein [Gammaproteobacteria bacterium]
MKVDNPLSREFLISYPNEAARVLEQVPVEHVVALFNALPLQICSPVLASMVPEKAVACFSIFSDALMAKLVSVLPTISLARIYRLLSSTKQAELLALLSDKSRSKLRRYMAYSPTSAGALLNPVVDLLPENITVADAIRRFENVEHTLACDIYIVNDAHKLSGVVELGKLFITSHHILLRDIMKRKTLSIPAHVNASSLLLHPGWKTHRRLPMVERDGTLIGALDYSYLQETLGESDGMLMNDPLENMLSLAGLYWLSLAQLLDSVLGIARNGRGDENER